MKETQDRKLIKFPITNQERRKNALGPRNVECVVSGRILSFRPESGWNGECEMLFVDVLPLGYYNDDGSAKKICEFTIAKDDLLRAVESVKSGKKEADD